MPTTGTSQVRQEAESIQQELKSVETTGLIQLETVILIFAQTLTKTASMMMLTL